MGVLGVFITIALESRNSDRDDNRREQRHKSSTVRRFYDAKGSNPRELSFNHLWPRRQERGGVTGGEVGGPEVGEWVLPPCSVCVSGIKQTSGAHRQSNAERLT